MRSGEAERGAVQSMASSSVAGLRLGCGRAPRSKGFIEMRRLLVADYWLLLAGCCLLVAGPVAGPVPPEPRPKGGRAAGGTVAEGGAAGFPSARPSCAALQRPVSSRQKSTARRRATATMAFLRAAP